MTMQKKALDTDVSLWFFMSRKSDPVVWVPEPTRSRPTAAKDPARVVQRLVRGVQAAHQHADEGSVEQVARGQRQLAQ